jgi:hypothetical protein
VVVTDDVVANIGFCGNDGDNGVDDAIVQSIADHTRKVVDATDSGPRDGGMHRLYSAIRRKLYSNCVFYLGIERIDTDV